MLDSALLFPTQIIQSLLLTVANNFVTDKNSGEVMTVGYVGHTWNQSVIYCTKIESEAVGVASRKVVSSGGFVISVIGQNPEEGTR